MKKRFSACFMIFAIVLSLVPTAGAAETVRLTLNVQQSGSAVPVQISLTGEQNYSAENATSLDVLPGSYAFDISDGGANHVRGTITVSGETTLTADLPDSAWIASAGISLRSGSDWAAVETANGAYLVPDHSGAALYPYLTPAEGVNTATCGVYPAGSATQEANRCVWESRQTVLRDCLAAQSMDGATVVLEARQASGDYEQYQTLALELLRVPTLSALTIAGVPFAFDPDTTDYSLLVSDETIHLTATPLCAGGQVLVNGTAVNGETSVALADLTRDGEVYLLPVELRNGFSRTYTLRLTKTDAARTTIAHEAGVSVVVLDAQGGTIAPFEAGQTESIFALLPGEHYTWRAILNENYRAEGSFLAADGQTLTAATPDTTATLSGLSVQPARTAAPYETTPAFSPETQEYAAFVGTNQTGVGVLATLASADWTMQVSYDDYRDWNSAFAGERTVALTSGTYRSLTACLGASGLGNTLRLEVMRTENAITYTQIYTVRLTRACQLANLEADGAALRQSDGTEGFSRDVTDYTLTVPRGQTALSLSAQLLSTAAGNDNAFFLDAVCGETQQSLDFSALAVEQAQTLSFTLNPLADSETITLTVRREGAVSRSYRITVAKAETIPVRFAVTPSDAVVYLASQETGQRVLPDAEGNYALCAGADYRYTVTKYGYCAAAASFTASAGTLTIALERAAEHPLRDIAAAGDWLSFRGNAQNNAVTNAPLPTSAADATLLWANKLGEGYSEGAVGSPILVGGCLYTYANDTVFKVDKNTGEILVAKPMDHTSSFSITPPAYGEGMLFVGLSNGTVQAFDAETLDSLWIYRDALGGQPNCPITYHDGFLYTGFWNAETRQANFVCLSVTDEDPTLEKEEKQASWLYPHNGFYWAGAYVTDDYLLVTTDDGANGYTSGYGSLLSLDSRTGELLDEVTMPHVGDLRGTICYDDGTCYFTSKGGDFYAVNVSDSGELDESSLRRLHLDNGTNDATTPPMSTSTPVVYRGRAYIGVSGAGQFSAYSGHNLTVIDLDSWSIAYTIPTQGYPQTSGLLTTAYSEVYVYFFDNYTPGKLRVIRDTPGQSAPDPAYLTTETYRVGGAERTIETAYVLFTPSGEQAQYAICSPIVDADGNLYFKNDSAYLMCLSSRIVSLRVETQPEKTDYAPGECFDAAGMTVVATYANGVQRDVTPYIRHSTQPLTAEDTELTLWLDFGAYAQLYGNANGQTGVETTLPTATLSLKIAAEDEPCNGGATCPGAAFSDMPAANDWAHKGIDYAIKNGLLNGVGGGKIDPNGQLTRAMLVTILWRFAGQPADGENPFTDVPKQKWYTQAVAWAAKNGIVNGMSETTFEPDTPITREQIATILFRYVRRQGLDNGARGDFSRFADGALVSGWADEALRWATANGVLNGSKEANGLYLNPQSNATRAETATLMMNFIQKLFNR